MNSNSARIKARSFYIYNKDGSLKEDLKTFWLESRTISYKDIQFGAIDSVMKHGTFRIQMPALLAKKLWEEDTVDVIISYQQTIEGENWAVLRLIDQRKLEEYNAKI